MDRIVYEEAGKISEKHSWDKVVTTRRYLHPPKSERMYTLWSEGKIILGQVVDCVDFKSNFKLDCFGLWFAYGEEDCQFDFRSAKQSVTDDGTPIHTLTFNTNGIITSIEAFCDTARKSTCFVRVRVKNETGKKASHRLAMLLRQGRENTLVFGAPDVYKSYAPDINIWKNIISSFREKNEHLYYDEDVFVLFDSSVKTTWDAQKGAVRTEFNLEEGEEKEYSFAFGKGKPLSFDYEQEKKNMQNFWKREFERLYAFPESILKKPETVKLIRSFVAQMLQCFCYHVGGNNLFARQGGLDRQTWPGEFIQVLETFGEIGEFGDYIEPVIENCFLNQQAPDGEIRPEGEPWACITGCILYNFAKYSIDCSQRFYYRFRDNAIAAFEWIKKTRTLSKDSESETAGFFPPMRSCDWKDSHQAWIGTDLSNLVAIELFAEAAKKFGDSYYQIIKDEADDYRNTFRKVFEKHAEKYKGDILPIPLSPNNDDEKLFRELKFLRIGVARFIKYGIVKKEDMYRVKKWLEEENLCKNGLFGKMIMHDPHIWYTTFSEYFWHHCFLMAGDIKNAQKTLDAILNYTVTTECYTVERYKDDDPYFAPWSPNASGNARIISMIMAQEKAL